MTELNNKFTNAEQELAKLEEFETQLGKIRTSFEYLYSGSRWVPRFRRDNFTPENIEKLLLNVLLLKDIIVGENGLLELARQKKLDIEKSLYYAPTKKIFKELKRRQKTGHVWAEEDAWSIEGDNISKGDWLLKGDGSQGITELKLKVSGKTKTNNCANCEAPAPYGRTLCEDCFNEEKKVVAYLEGNQNTIQRVECKKCKEMHPIVNWNGKYLIDPETQICWHCERKSGEESYE